MDQDPLAWVEHVLTIEKVGGEPYSVFKWSALFDSRHSLSSLFRNLQLRQLLSSKLCPVLGYLMATVKVLTVLPHNWICSLLALTITNGSPFVVIKWKAVGDISTGHEWHNARLPDFVRAWTCQFMMQATGTSSPADWKWLVIPTGHSEPRLISRFANPLYPWFRTFVDLYGVLLANLSLWEAQQSYKVGSSALFVHT
jgi:hypothetical protein